ncbi:hypothetical protein Q1695_004208 [Nippostrongylus brasiliensis]|nr:hypothetical protein Q1695_004208 [Nippostrongylus brasiliensis]
MNLYRCVLLLALATTCYATCTTLRTFDRYNITNTLRKTVNRCAFFKNALANGKYYFSIRKIKYDNRVVFIVRANDSYGDEAFMEIPRDFSTYRVPQEKEYTKYQNCPLKRRKEKKQRN